jgi:hypothetical protein
MISLIFYNIFPFHLLIFLDIMEVYHKATKADDVQNLYCLGAANIMVSNVPNIT